MRTGNLMMIVYSHSVHVCGQSVIMSHSFYVCVGQRRVMQYSAMDHLWTSLINSASVHNAL